MKIVRYIPKKGNYKPLLNELVLKNFERHLTKEAASRKEMYPPVEKAGDPTKTYYDLVDKK